ncbi:MAG: hypothetical protein AAF703_03905 [Cyanobacteria bacterium P01_D01_bin.105]
MSERLEYVQKLETQIAAAKSHLDTLKADKKEALVAIQHEEVANLEKYLDQANVSLSGLNMASEDAWHALKEDIDRVLTSLRETVDKLLGK